MMHSDTKHGDFFLSYFECITMFMLFLSLYLCFSWVYSRLYVWPVIELSCTPCRTPWYHQKHTQTHNWTKNKKKWILGNLYHQLYLEMTSRGNIFLILRQILHRMQEYHDFSNTGSTLYTGWPPKKREWDFVSENNQ